jgi:hypothetical protein
MMIPAIVAAVGGGVGAAAFFYPIIISAFRTRRSCSIFPCSSSSPL